MTAVYSCAYFPNIAYMSSMLFHDKILIEKWENYIKQSYRSRCYIVGANGIQPLIVPVEGGRKKKLIKDIRISSREPWSSRHYKSIASAYGKAPYYEHFIDGFQAILSKRHTFLFDLCIETLTVCLGMLGIEKMFSETEKFIHSYVDGENDLRAIFDAKNPGSYPEFYIPQKYFQLFGKHFVDNLSVIDLIMSEGPQALSILKSSFKEGLNK